MPGVAVAKPPAPATTRSGFRCGCREYRQRSGHRRQARDATTARADFILVWRTCRAVSYGERTAPPGNTLPRTTKLAAKTDEEETRASDGHPSSRLLSSSRGLPVGVPGAHPGSRVHPADLEWALHRRLHG